MCGLVTLISKRQWGFNHKDLDVFEELLTVDQLRGQDATGAFCVHRNKQVSGVKGAFTPWHLFKQPEYNSFRNKASGTGRILVGHNRKATQGAASNPENAHPFVEDNIILVHNGSLWNRNGMPQRDVDSHAVAAAFKEGHYDDVISKVNGAYVFIWWDMKANMLRLVRNKERPLWKIENKDSIFFCSEAWMGRGVLARNGLGGKGEEFEVSEVKTDLILHYEIGGKLVEEEGVKKAPVVVQTPTTATNSNNGVQHGNGNKATHTTTTTPAHGTNHGAVNLFAMPSFRVGDRIIAQINNVRADTNETRFKAVGITVEPNQPIVDFTAVLPDYVCAGAVDRWQQFPISGEVVAITSSIRGPSVTLKNLAFCGLVQTHPSRVITVQDWDFVVEHCTCKHCNQQVGEYEPGFTSVKPTVIKDKRNYEVTCADCIEEKIRSTDPEVAEEFSKGRIDALQKWEQIGLRASSGAIESTTVQGNSTAH